MPIFRPENLKEIVKRTLIAAGTPGNNAEIVADHLIKAQLYGHDSHGVIRLHAYIRQIQGRTLKPDAHISIAKHAPSTAIIDGNLGFGQVVAREAMMVAIKKAKETGVAVVTLVKYSHTGRLGEYTEIAAQHGCIGFMVNNGGWDQAPYGSIDPIYGANPFSVCIPAGTYRRILYDGSTSIVAGGKIEIASAARKPIPLGWCIDFDGNPTMNPDDFRPPIRIRTAKGTPETRRGALLPFGGYKGSALALIVEVLGGALAGLGVPDDVVEAGTLLVKDKGRGSVLGAIDIAAFKDINEFMHSVDNLIKLVKSSRKAKGFEEILVAGEPELKTEAERREKDLYVDGITWETIQEDAKKLNVDLSDIMPRLES